MSDPIPPTRVLLVGMLILVTWLMGAGCIQAVNSQSPSAETPYVGQVVRELTATWENNPIYLTHRCDGSVEPSRAVNDRSRSHPFCIGRNLLVYTSPQGDKHVISDTYVVGLAEAPVLLGAHLLESGIWYISYAPDSCTTERACDGELPDQNVTLAVALATGETRPIQHFPLYGTPLWNNTQTHAIVLPHTCTNDGCNVAPLQRYDIASDTLSILTVEAAAEKPNVTNSAGQALPTWANLQWASDTSVSATIVYPNGTRKNVRVDL